MAQYRVTVRHGGARPQYEVLDVDAASLREALGQAAERIAPEIDATADLVEIRRQTLPEDRERSTVQP